MSTTTTTTTTTKAKATTTKAKATTTKAKATKVKATLIKATKVKAIEYNVPMATPSRGKDLFNYTHAVLQTLGMLTTGRKAAATTAFKAFYPTPTAYTYHKRIGNFEATPGAGMRLTVQGYNKFSGRETGREVGQEITQDAVDAISAYFKTGKASKNAPAWLQGAKPRKVTIATK